MGRRPPTPGASAARLPPLHNVRLHDPLGAAASPRPGTHGGQRPLDGPGRRGRRAGAPIGRRQQVGKISRRGMTISGRGWELLVERQCVQTAGDRRRTWGRYQVYRDGVAAAALAGFMCECVGPGNNAVADTGLRIEPGRYPLHHPVRALSHCGLQSGSERGRA